MSVKALVEEAFGAGMDHAVCAGSREGRYLSVRDAITRELNRRIREAKK